MAVLTQHRPNGGYAGRRYGSFAGKTPKLVVLTLTSDGTTPAAALTGLKWAFFDQVTPNLFVAPVAQGAIETTDGTGLLEINVSGTTLSAGQTGWLTITDSDGTVTQNPPAKAFSGPVLVS